MKKRILIVSSIFVFLLGGLNLNAKENIRVQAEPSTHNAEPERAQKIAYNGLSLMKKDLNLDKDTAIKIAEAVLVKIYGEKVLEQRPWIVEEKDNSFFIKGTFHKQGIAFGGVAKIEISKSDGSVIGYVHGK